MYRCWALLLRLRWRIGIFPQWEVAPSVDLSLGHLWSVFFWFGCMPPFGPDSAPAKTDFRNGDTNHALIKTAKGRLIEIRYDTTSPRPAGMGQYSLQGTKGAFEAALGQRMLYLEGRTEGEKWEPLEKYVPEFRHPRWIKEGDAARSSGHYGGDYFVIADFLNSIRTGESPIDVVEAVTWSSIRPLSADSIAAGSKPVEVPDFAA